MRGIFTLIGFGLFVVAAAGWYLDWYHIHSTSTSTGQQTITIDVNRNKVAEDLKKGEEKVFQAINHNTDQTPGSTLPPPPPLPSASIPNNKETGFFNITQGKDGGVQVQLPSLPPIFQPNK